MSTETQVGKPTLHHLNNSQSQRILWLLEELGIPYDVVLYERETSGPRLQRAPLSLTKIHPLGKSPILVTSTGQVIVESTTITKYLLKTYDTTGKFATKDWIRSDSLISFGSATMGPTGVMKIFFDSMTAFSPAIVRPIVRFITGKIDGLFSGPAKIQEFEYLESMLGGKEGKEDWFAGDGAKEPGEVDFVLIWPVDFAIQRRWIDMSKFPKVRAWRERVLERPAWKRGLEKGNGYDFSF